MNEQEIIGIVKETPKILSAVYKDLAQPSVKKIGSALETVFEFSTAILLPLKLQNEKFKINFEKRLNEYRKKIEKIEEGKLVEVNPQIGTPLIEKLSYTTNDEIADLFTSLLAKASNVDTVNAAHPSFVQMIERLSVDEARIIKHLMNKDFIPCVSVRADLNNQPGFIMLARNATTIPKDVAMLFPKNIGTYLDNLTSMGVLNISHMNHKADEKLYAPIYEFMNFEEIKNANLVSRMFKNITPQKSYYQITDFGKLFIRACNSEQLVIGECNTNCVTG